MKTNETTEALKLALDAARAAKEASPSPETRDAYVKAYNAYSTALAALNPPKRNGASSRAGQRQLAEMLAQCKRRK